ncbi:MAG: hypothetical protein JW880_05035 [Candidatus Thermoplasmatota archaeon]|nr:hypothetical protein [Candidatus Thermoplasmatota archaeon]
MGAVIGLAAIFSTWVKIGYLFWGTELNLIDVLNHAEDSLLVAGCWLFLAGTLIAFLSPEGGTLQLAGVVLFTSWFVGETDKMPSGAGPYMGLASAVLVMASFAVPLGIGYGGRKVRLRERFLAIGSIPESVDSPTPEE